MIVVEPTTEPWKFKELMSLKKQGPQATDSAKSITQMLSGTQIYSDGKKIAQLVSRAGMVSNRTALSPVFSAGCHYFHCVSFLQ
jgi:hypothetical protein